MSLLRTFSVLLLPFALIFSVSCGPSETEIAALQQAEEATARNDSMENALVETMDEINKNLDQIREKQGLISVNSPENLSRKNEILQNISLINSLIEDNRNKLDQLTMQVRKLGKEKNALARIADQAKERVRKQEEEIASLKDLLEKESFKVADLNRRVEELETTNAGLTSEKDLLSEGNAKLDKDLNKGFFTYGTMQELVNKQLVEKKGGFLGLGKKEALAAAFTRNKGAFAEIDIREAKVIPLHGKKPKLLTQHPEGSYEIQPQGKDGEYSNLLIKEPEDFWSSSRFLVVEVH